MLPRSASLLKCLIWREAEDDSWPIPIADIHFRTSTFDPLQMKRPTVACVLSLPFGGPREREKKKSIVAHYISRGIVMGGFFRRAYRHSDNVFSSRQHN